MFPPTALFCDGLLHCPPAPRSSTGLEHRKQMFHHWNKLRIAWHGGWLKVVLKSFLDWGFYRNSVVPGHGGWTCFCECKPFSFWIWRKKKKVLAIWHHISLQSWDILLSNKQTSLWTWTSQHGTGIIQSITAVQKHREETVLIDGQIAYSWDYYPRSKERSPNVCSVIIREGCVAT